MKPDNSVFLLDGWSLDDDSEQDSSATSSEVHYIYVPLFKLHLNKKIKCKKV